MSYAGPKWSKFRQEYDILKASRDFARTTVDDHPNRATL